MTYKLDLREYSKVHPAFHVSHLQKQLGQNDNIINTGVLVDMIESHLVFLMNRNVSWIHMSSTLSIILEDKF